LGDGDSVDERRDYKRCVLKGFTDGRESFDEFAGSLVEVMMHFIELSADGFAF
jgi:hypothetical protein